VTKHDVDVSEFAVELSGGPARKNGKSPKKGPAYEVSPKEDAQLPDGATAVEAVKRLATLKTKQQPFFLAVGFLKPHLPFVAPKKYWDLYNPNDIPLPATDKLPAGTPDFVAHTNGELHGYPGVPKENPIPADFAKTLRHGYYACISYTDAQIGKVLDALEKEGLADSTIIVLWGDHGWQLGDHGLWHKHTNFEIAARSPLLISVPKTASAGKKCDAPVEFVDVYPTLADLCGLPIPSGLAGASLKRYIENPAAPMQKPAISQYPRSSPEHGGQLMGYSVRTERWRATFWRKRNGADIGFTELYDEASDPAETANLAQKPEHKELLASLIKYLPPVGADAPPEKKGTGKPKTAAKAKPASADEPRDARYDRLYPGKPRLTLDEYFAGQGGDQAVAKERFGKFDADKDGFVTRDEFISGGSKRSSTK
jgi:iduronate 2-sulfatase